MDYFEVESITIENLKRTQKSYAICDVIIKLNKKFNVTNIKLENMEGYWEKEGGFLFTWESLRKFATEIAKKSISLTPIEQFNLVAKLHFIANYMGTKHTHLENLTLYF